MIYLYSAFFLMKLEFKFEIISKIFWSIYIELCWDSDLVKIIFNIDYCNTLKKGKVHDLDRKLFAFYGKCEDLWLQRINPSPTATAYRLFSLEIYKFFKKIYQKKNITAKKRNLFSNLTSKKRFFLFKSNKSFWHKLFLKAREKKNHSIVVFDFVYFSFILQSKLFNKKIKNYRKSPKII